VTHLAGSEVDSSSGFAGSRGRRRSVSVAAARPAGRPGAGWSSTAAGAYK